MWNQLLDERTLNRSQFDGQLDKAYYVEMVSYSLQHKQWHEYNMPLLLVW